MSVTFDEAKRYLPPWGNSTLKTVLLDIDFTPQVLRTDWMVSAISAKRRVQYARGFLALEMFDEARAEIRMISDQVEALPPDAIFLLDGINERAAEVPVNSQNQACVG